MKYKYRIQYIYILAIIYIFIHFENIIILFDYLIKNCKISYYYQYMNSNINC